MENIINKKKIIVKEIFYFLNFLLITLFLLELLVKGMISFYLNINFLIIICLSFSIVDLVVNN